jgi:hypothetical protein
MFNEAFLFFWAVGLVESLAIVLTLAGLVNMICCIPIALEYDCAYKDRKAKYLKILKRLIAGTVGCWLLAAALPPSEAFYAGKLKDAIDAKLVELADDTGDTK